MSLQKRPYVIVYPVSESLPSTFLKEHGINAKNTFKLQQSFIFGFFIFSEPTTCTTSIGLGHHWFPLDLEP